MTEPTAAELTAAYRSFRLRMTEIGRALDPATASAKTPTCPDWSTKDVLAHMTGIAADILDGNVEGAATEAWADAQVERRREASLGDVLDEWDAKGPELEALLEQVAPGIAYQFYLDGWTHEWDVRQALETPATEPDFSFVAHAVPKLLDSIAERIDGNGLSLELTITGLPSGPVTRSVGPTPAIRSLHAFEFLRITMGRRSPRQVLERLEAASLPSGDWVDTLVVWTPNSFDIVDPVLL